MDSLPFSTNILMINSSHSQELVCLIMASFITHRLHVKEEKMDKDFHSATCKKGDQPMAVITLCSSKMGANNMQTQRRQRLMCQDGRAIQDRQTRRGESMDKGSIGMIVEIYTLGDITMTTELKERSTSCNRMALTHSMMSSMMKTTKKRFREN